MYLNLLSYFFSVLLFMFILKKERKKTSRSRSSKFIVLDFIKIDIFLMIMIMTSDIHIMFFFQRDLLFPTKRKWGVFRMTYMQNMPNKVEYIF